MDAAAEAKAYTDQELRKLRAEMASRGQVWKHGDTHRAGGFDSLPAAGGPPTGPAGGGLSGNYPNPLVNSVPPTGPAGGELGGTYPNPVFSNLTAQYDQSGAFDWVYRGGNLLVANSKSLKLYSDNGAGTPTTIVGEWRASDGHLAAGVAASDTAVLVVTQAFIDALTTITAVSGSITDTLNADNANQIRGNLFSAGVIGAAGVRAQTGIVKCIVAASTFTNNGTSLAVSDARIFDVAAVSIGAGVTVAALHGLRLIDATGLGALTVQYGIYLPNFTKGATNWAIYSLGGNSSHLGSFQFGGNATPASVVDVRGAITLGGMAAPATPAAGDIVVYDETGTSLLKAKDSAGLVYDLTHLHVVHFMLDGTVTTQKAPGPPMPHAGVITNVFLKTADGVTVGATAAIVQVYKVPVANVNTDGGTTSIFTTAPTITNGNMRQNYGAPDLTTTFAAGDVLVAAVTQVGTGVTFIGVSVTVRYT